MTNHKLVSLFSPKFKSSLNLFRCGAYNVYLRYDLVCKLLIELRKKLKKDKIRILDVGGGQGVLKSFLDENKFIYELVETSQEKIDFALNNKISSKLFDGSKLPFKDNSFDIILCTHVLEHIPDEQIREELCSEILRVSKGYTVLVFPYGKFYRYYDRLGLKLLKKIKRSDIPTYSNIKQHLELPPINMDHIKKIYKVAEVRYATNCRIWLIALFLGVCTPEILRGIIISIINPLFRFLSQTKPKRDAVVIYHKKEATNN